MSTVVYPAYKLRDPSEMWKIVTDTQFKGRALAMDAVIELAQAMTVREDSEAFKKALDFCDGDRDRATRHASWEVLTEEYKENTTSSHRSPWNLDVSVGFYEWKGHVYLRPFCDWTMRDVLNFLAKDKRLQDYSYDNRSDRPKKISERNWEARRKVWHEVQDFGRIEACLVLHIVDWKSFWWFKHQAQEKVRKALGGVEARA